jgi:hypothetical protein
VGYSSGNVSITEALNILKARGVTQPDEALLQVLREGEIIVTGLVGYGEPHLPAGRQSLHPTWWYHVNSPLDCNVVWFERVTTNPPTPFRAEQLELPRAAIDTLWPEAANLQLKQSCPKATKAKLIEWAKRRWPNSDELPGRDKLLAEARKEFSGVREKNHIRPLRQKLASAKNKKGGAPSHTKNRRTS